MATYPEAAPQPFQIFNICIMKLFTHPFNMPRLPPIHLYPVERRLVAAKRRLAILSCQTDRFGRQGTGYGGVLHCDEARVASGFY